MPQHNTTKVHTASKHLPSYKKTGKKGTGMFTDAVTVKRMSGK